MCSELRNIFKTNNVKKVNTKNTMFVKEIITSNTNNKLQKIGDKIKKVSGFNNERD